MSDFIPGIAMDSRYSDKQKKKSSLNRFHNDWEDYLLSFRERSSIHKPEQLEIGADMYICVVAYD